MELSANPLVSVITCFYREEKFLEETIRSVVDQTYRNWELILVDDGSPDGSPAIAKRFASEYPGKVNYLQHANHANKGVCKSRNYGIAHAKGELIAYLDADDVWLKEKLQKQVDIFHQHPEATVLLEASEYWNSWETPGRRNVVIEIGVDQNKLYHPPGLMLQLYPLGKGAAPCPSGMMVKKSVHDHISFVEDFKGAIAVYEDQAFLAQVYLKEKVYVSSGCHNRYRQRHDSQVFTVHQNGRYREVRRYYLEWFQRYLEDNSIHDERINRLLKKAFMPYHHPLTYQLLYQVPAKVRNKIGRIVKRLLKS